MDFRDSMYRRILILTASVLVIAGCAANPKPINVRISDEMTATSRGRIPGNSNGNTSKIGDTIQISPITVRHSRTHITTKYLLPGNNSKFDANP